MTSGTCENPGEPCTIYAAADANAAGIQAGDEVVLAPGEYSDSAGDLGPSEFVQLAPAIRVHGEAGAPRPKIVLEGSSALRGALIVEEGDTLSHLEIVTSVARSNIEVENGLVEDLIARNGSATQSIACVQVAGTIRNSACLTSAPESVALGESTATALSSTATLRNVTAIDTGSGGVGLSYKVFGSGGVSVDGKSVIAEGRLKDVLAAAREFSGSVGQVAVALAHSDFDSTEASADPGGSASVTAAGTDGNVEAPPLLGADGYHELSGSPTIDAGETDVSSASTDIDGQARAIGKPDIGADEYIHPISLALACTPEEVILTQALPTGGTTCRVTVTDETETPLPFAGEVDFSATGSGAFEANSCSLPASSEASTGCQVNYLLKPGSLGAHQISANFAGDADHEGGQGNASVRVTELPPEVCPASSSSCRELGPPARPALLIEIGVRPAKKTAKRLVRFTFSASPNGASFECKLDKGPFRSCRSPYRQKVRPGRHRFSLRAADGEGSSSTTSYSWRVLRRGPR